jgi:hypothetical protein
MGLVHEFGIETQLRDAGERLVAEFIVANAAYQQNIVSQSPCVRREVQWRPSQTSRMLKNIPKDFPKNQDTRREDRRIMPIL